MNRSSRREFLERSMLASAAAVAVSQTGTLRAVEENPAAVSANEKMSVAVVGVRGRGGDHLNGFSASKFTQVTHICDVVIVLHNDNFMTVAKNGFNPGSASEATSLKSQLSFLHIKNALR